MVSAPRITLPPLVKAHDIAWARGKHEIIQPKVSLTLDADVSILSLAYAEMFIVVAVLIRHFGMTLHKTEEKDVAIMRDRIFGYPENPSKGVRVYIIELKQ